MSNLILRTVGAAALVALGTATFTGTALAGGKGGGTATAVGCTSSSTQSGNFFVINWFGNFFNGMTVGSNCSHN